MSSFLGQTFGHVQALTHTAAQSLGQAANTPEELRVGSHSLLVKERVAEGGFGFVDLVTEIHSKKDFVLKRCNVDREAAFATVKKEINILQRFAGPYVVQLIDTDIITKNRTSREALLLLDYCPGGHLLERLNKRGGKFLPEESIFRMFGQLLLALKPMHESRPYVVHRDLKLENILFGTDGKVRLCDFGSCVEGPTHVRNSSEREAAEEIIAKETTQMYRAPEMVDLYMRDVITEATDVWALGCILYALCFLKHPIQDAGPLGILSAKIVFPKDSPFSADTHAFILKMLDVDPEARLTVQQCLECTAALAGHRALPDHPLTEEAQRKRAERIAANTLRESKNVKKVAAPVAPRKAAPLEANSVAARRLAAKRGVASGGSTPSDLLGSFSPGGTASTAQSTSDSTQHSHLNSAESEFTVDFDAFAAAPTSIGLPPQQKQQQQQQQQFASFDSNISSSAASSGRDSFARRLPSPPVISAAAGAQLADASSLFDDDDDDAAAQPPPQASQPRSQSNSAKVGSNSNNVASFDAFAPSTASAASSSFGDFDSTAPSASQPTATVTSTTSRSRAASTTTATSKPTAGFDTFDSFDNQQQQSSSSSSSSSFAASSSDPFGAPLALSATSKPTAGFDTFDSFDNQQQQSSSSSSSSSFAASSSDPFGAPLALSAAQFGGTDAFAPSTNTDDFFASTSSSSAATSGFEPTKASSSFTATTIAAPPAAKQNSTNKRRPSQQVKDVSHGIDLLGVSDEPHHSAAPPSSSVAASFDLFDDGPGASTGSGRDSFVATSAASRDSPAAAVHRGSFSGPPPAPSTAAPSFMDDLLIPQQAVPSRPLSSRLSSGSRDPQDVLSLFDKPKPVPPPKPAKPVMLNSGGGLGGGGGMMMGIGVGMMGPSGASGGGVNMMVSPQQRGGFAPDFSPQGRGPGMFASPVMSPYGQQQQGPGSAMSGGSAHGSFRSPVPQQQQPFNSRPLPQQPLSGGGYQQFQTNRSVDPFDSIGALSNSNSANNSSKKR